MNSAALLLAAGLLLCAWSLIVPIFEAPDEPAHWQYARHLHDHRALPLYAPGFEEANSPPLYYVAIAPLAWESALPSSVVASRSDGALHLLAPPRRFLNTDRDARRYVPIRFARLASLLMSVITIGLCYRLGLAATGRTDTALLTALFVGLLPQFTFRGSQVSNDALVTLWAAATTLAAVRLVRDPFQWRVALAGAVALAAAYLSKINAIALVVPFAFALVIGPAPASSAASPRTPPSPARMLRLAALGLALLLVLPWTVRTIALYGDPFASGAMRTSVAHIITDRPLLSHYFVTEFPVYLALSFVGNFGWANVLLPLWAYLLYGALFLGAAAGLVRGLRRGTIDRRLVLLLVIAGLASLAVVVHINRSFTQAQGRYLFPALPAFALLVALGLGQLPGRLSGLITPVRYGVLFGAVNLYALGGVVAPAYWPAPDRWRSPDERLLQPAALVDLVGTADGTLVVSGPDPSWTTPADIEAGDISSLVLEMRGTASPAAQRGCVLFATRTRGMPHNRPACFSWTADGSRQRIAIPLTGQPDWTGFVTHLRVDPFDSDPQPGWRVVHECALLLRSPQR